MRENTEYYMCVLFIETSFMRKHIETHTSVVFDYYYK